MYGESGLIRSLGIFLFVRGFDALIVWPVGSQYFDPPPEKYAIEKLVLLT